MPDIANSDLARHVCSSRLCEGSEFQSPYRCGPPREPKLAEVFAHWATLVEDGTWMLDENGVCTEHSWFDDNTTKAKVSPSPLASNSKSSNIDHASAFNGMIIF